MRLHLIIGALLLNGTLWGQIDTRISPVPAPAEPAQTTPASKWTGAPLAGFLSDTLGSGLREGLETTFAVSEAATNRNPSALGSGYDVDEVSRITGTMSFQQDWSRSSFLAQYVGGTDFYVKNSYLDEQFHRLSTSGVLKLSRWNLSLGQSFSYLPQSSFGFDPAHVVGNGVAAVSDPGTTPALDVFLPPNVIERTLATTASAQYLLGPRSAATFDGQFSDLHFSGASPGVVLVDSQIFSVGAQFSYDLNRYNTVGAAYHFGQGRALGFGSVIQTHSAVVTYRREVGSHLTIQAAAGPQFSTFNAAGLDINLGVSATVDLTADYQLGRTDFAASYFRGINPGSGLFLGSQNNDVRGSVERLLGRTLTASLSVGHGQNDSLGITRINAAQEISSTYLTVSAEKGLGRLLSGFVSYSLQNQDGNHALCSASGCTSFPITHSGTIGLRFHIHPLTLRP